MERMEHMNYHSILYPTSVIPTLMQKEPMYFKDLNLDQIIEKVVDNRTDLLPYFYTPVTDVNAIQYRQDVFKDIEAETIREAVDVFVSKIEIITRRVADIKKNIKFSRKSGEYLLKGGLLFQIERYLDSIHIFVEIMKSQPIQSDGLILFTDYLNRYQKSDEIRALAMTTTKLRERLQQINYLIQIRGPLVKVCDTNDEEDNRIKDIIKLFQKFPSVAAFCKTINQDEPIYFAEHIENQIVDFVATFHKSIFNELTDYTKNNMNVLDKKIINFAHDIEFYLLYNKYIDQLRNKSLSFCYPTMTKVAENIFDTQGFDLALAQHLLYQEHTVVWNDFAMHDKERIMYISGSNQGGKTTYARAFGQIHYFANLGLPVPGTEARLLLFDMIFTHFETQEKIEDLDGKLVQELKALKHIITNATSNSIIILNEVLSSTTIKDAIYIYQSIMKQIEKINCICVNVTFIDTIIKINDTSFSVVSQGTENFSPENAYMMKREEPKGIAHAIDIAKNYHLTYESIKKRVSK